MIFKILQTNWPCLASMMRFGFSPLICLCENVWDPLGMTLCTSLVVNNNFKSLAEISKSVKTRIKNILFSVTSIIYLKNFFLSKWFETIFRYLNWWAVKYILSLEKKIKSFIKTVKTGIHMIIKRSETLYLQSDRSLNI